MKSLAAFTGVDVAVAWVLWQLRPPHYTRFIESSYDRPYLMFAFESAVALAVGTTLLFAVLAMQRGLRETLVPWSASRLVRAQLLVLSGAVITGAYGIEQIVQMNSALRGDWGGEGTFWVTPIVVLALSPWILFVAAAAVSTVAAQVRGAVTVGVVVFDVLSIAYLAFIFVHLGHWACLTCSGSAL
jgi:hypothetical protein